MASRLALHRRPTTTVVALLISGGCGWHGPTAPPIEGPVHLEEHLDRARIDGAEASTHGPAAVEWSFREPQPSWKPVAPWQPGQARANISRTADALRFHLRPEHAATQPGGRVLQSAISLNIPEWSREDWAYVLVQARATPHVTRLSIGFNLRDQMSSMSGSEEGPFAFGGESVPIVADHSLRIYLLRADWSWGKWQGAWRQLGLLVSASEPAAFDLVSASLVPKEASYAGRRVGVRTEVRGIAHRRVIYLRAPGRLEYQVRLPRAARLDLGLGVLRVDAPVRFLVRVAPAGAAAETLLEETYADKERWGQRSLNLARWGGQQVALSLEAEAGRAGTIALWAAPTLSGALPSKRPNVVLYIIDGASAAFMSAYGYNRRTTPNLERLAAEGVLFERAYCNSSWSKTSTPSFMTSLHHSVLGGYRTDSDPLPEQATTLAEQMHHGGYQTAVFTSNPYAGTLSSLERGVDALRDAGVENNSRSSEELHEDFWRWREVHPGEPYWVHFQTTDVHWPHKPTPPFAGMFIEASLRDTFYEWERLVARAAGWLAPWWPGPDRYTTEVFKKAGVDRARFYNIFRGLYDETMAHNDHQIGRLVERLKASGEWERMLFIVAADHGTAGLLGLVHPEPARPWGAAYYSVAYRVPLIVSWPQRIAGGRRVIEAVSMIDVMPTILDLAGLPRAELSQGRSLAPLLLGQGTREPQPVVLDEFYVDQDTGALSGDIAFIEGRWLATLRVEPEKTAAVGAEGGHSRRPPLLLFDMWNPQRAASVHAERADLAAEYLRRLRDRWDEHRALARKLRRSGASPLTPEQLETLRSLGYIR